MHTFFKSGQAPSHATARAVLALLLAGVVLFLQACAAKPVVPPSELKSVSTEVRLSRLWKINVGESKKGLFEPLVIGDTVYAASRGGEVRAVDAQTGKTRWKETLNYRLSSGVGGNEEHVFVSTENGIVVALDAKTGDAVWEVPASSEVLAPASVGFGIMVVRSADGRLLTLDPQTGDENWTVSYTPPALTLNGYSRPLLLDGGVLVGLDDGRLMALSSENGGVIWETVLSIPSGRSEVERLVDIDANVRVDDSAIFAVNYQGRLVRVEPQRGQIAWSVPMSSSAGLTVSKNAVVVAVDKDELHAVDKETGQLLWEQKALRGRLLSAPQIVGDDHILVGDFEGYLHILSADDGRLIGRTRIARDPIFQEIIAIDDVVYVQSADGTLAALKQQ